jgi:hypothetical protein
LGSIFWLQHTFIMPNPLSKSATDFFPVGTSIHRG